MIAYSNQVEDIGIDVESLLVNAGGKGGVQTLGEPFGHHGTHGDGVDLGRMCLECLEHRQETSTSSPRSKRATLKSRPRKEM